MIEPGPTAGPASSGVWHRLHPATVLREIVLMGWNLVFVIIAGSAGGWFDGLFELALPVIVVLFGVARYLSTRYQVTPDVVRFRRGVFMRKRMELPRDRIQNVTESADLMSRLFSLQTVTISSAGAEGEIQLAVVSAGEAERLTRELVASTGGLDGLSAAPPGLAASPPFPPHETASLAPPTSPAAPIAAVPSTLPSSVPAPVPSSALAATAPPDAATRIEHQPSAAPRYLLTTKQFLLYAVTGEVTAALMTMVWTLPVAWWMLSAGEMGVMPMLVVMGGIATPLIVAIDVFEFRLDVGRERLRVQHGLFSKHEGWARRERLQLLEVRRPWLRRRLGWETIAVATADITPGRGKAFDLCAPMVAVDSWQTMVPDLMESVAVGEADVHSVSRRSIRRRVIRPLVPTVLFLALSAAALVLGTDAAAFTLPTVDATTEAVLGWGWPLVLAPLAAVWFWWLAKRSWLVDGWARSDQHLLVRRGRFSTTLHVARLAKIQDVQLRATFFQRRLGLASLVVDTANLGPSLFLPDLERSVAERLADDLVTEATKVALVDGV